MERAKIFTCLICTIWFLLGPAVYGQTEPVEAADPTREQSSVQTPSAQQCLQAAVEAIGGRVVAVAGELTNLHVTDPHSLEVIRRLADLTAPADRSSGRSEALLGQERRL